MPVSPPGFGPLKPRFDRRRFLQYGMITTVASLFPAPILAAVERVLTPERHLSFYNTHTSESLEICYYRQGYYCTTALARINYILRDHRTDEIKTIDIRLLDLLFDISATLQTRSPYHVISGYRSRASNKMLRRKSKKVAASSFHMRGMAIDIRLPGCLTSRLREIASDQQKGGVGYYPRSDFVHVDTGRVRYW
ncbi:MAG: DUF882 domain-containing protein [Deltaproteobacteria bacterium]|nr:MAG: DUF882 domain-containing protein [Deltaproteobacteria bacterium]